MANNRRPRVRRGDAALRVDAEPLQADDASLAAPLGETPMASLSSPMPQPADLRADWFGALSQMWWAAQGAQWQAVTAWQQAAAAVQQELWDEWAARWAGGAPLGD
jgi:hypothetical protein